MELKKAINGRRSIRRFRSDPIEPDKINAILQAAVAAPSAKNRQPWRFVVVSGVAKEEMLRTMAEGIERESNGQGLMPGIARWASSALYTLEIMRQAPVTIFVLDGEAEAMALPKDHEQYLLSLTNVQSIGAAIENMLLAAEGEGLGALWICDIFFAYRELVTWLGTDCRIVAAVSLGIADEAPAARPRMPLDDVVQWRNE